MYCTNQAELNVALLMITNAAPANFSSPLQLSFSVDQRTNVHSEVTLALLDHPQCEA